MYITYEQNVRGFMVKLYYYDGTILYTKYTFIGYMTYDCGMWK